MNTVGTLNAVTRDQWIEQHLRSLAPGLRLLDAGAGEQPYRKFCDHLSYVSQDFCEYRPTSGETGLHMPQWDYGRLDIVGDVTSISEPDASFDVVLCTEVCEHISEPVAALREFARLLRPGGILILTAPFCSLTHFAPYHFATGFSRYFYEHHLPAHGFKIVEMTPNGNYFEYLAQEVRRIESIAERYANTQVQEWERWGLQAVLDMLETLSERDQGSSELLNFGYHVRAVRG